MTGPFYEPPPEFLRTQESAKQAFLTQIKKATTETHIKLVCRTYANLIGPAVMGPIWLIDSKAVTKMMWNTHSKTQMAFIWGLISYLPEAVPPAKEQH